VGVGSVGRPHGRRTLRQPGPGLLRAPGLEGHRTTGGHGAGRALPLRPVVRGVPGTDPRPLGRSRHPRRPPGRQRSSPSPTPSTPTGTSGTSRRWKPPATPAGSRRSGT